MEDTYETVLALVLISTIFILADIHERGFSGATFMALLANGAVFIVGVILPILHGLTEMIFG